MDRLACVDLGLDRESRDSAPLSSLLRRLRRFSPEVAPATDDPGIYWLSAGGLHRLFSSLREWAGGVDGDLRDAGFDPTVVVGFTKFGTYALSKTRSGVFVIESPEREKMEVSSVPLKALGLFRTSELDQLVRLGKHSVGELLELPKSGVLERFGPDVYRVFTSASGDPWQPTVVAAPKKRVQTRVDFETPENDALRLTFVIKGLLHKILRGLAEKKEAVAALEITLKAERLDRKAPRTEIIKPAASTLDEIQLTDLVRLRLESVDLEIGVIELLLVIKTVPIALRQRQLFRRTARDLEAADRSLARLRAEFGESAVTRVVLKEGHLPEACFAFEALDRLQSSANAITKGTNEIGDGTDTPPQRTLVRRILTRPIPLQTRPVVGPRGCHLQGMGEAPAARVFGPYIVAGGWWVNDIKREYYFTETETGRIHWVYFDGKRRRWFLHGEVA